MAELLIKEEGQEDRRLELNRLVMTVGFGEDCDVNLSDQYDPVRLGMIIKKGNEITFKPLMNPYELSCNGETVDSMLILQTGHFIEIGPIQFGLVKNNTFKTSQANDLPPLPKPAELPQSSPPIKSSLAALQAYSNTLKTVHFAKEENTKAEEVVQIGQTQPQPKTHSKPTQAPKEAIKESSIKVAKTITKEDLKSLLKKVLSDLENPLDYPSQQREKSLKLLIQKHTQDITAKEEKEQTEEIIFEEIYSSKAIQKAVSETDTLVRLNQMHLMRYDLDNHELDSKKAFVNQNHYLWSFIKFMEEQGYSISKDTITFKGFSQQHFFEGYISTNNVECLIHCRIDTVKSQRLNKQDAEFLEQVDLRNNGILLYQEGHPLIKFFQRYKKGLKNKTLLYFSPNLLKPNENIQIAHTKFIFCSSYDELIEYLNLQQLIDVVVSDDQNADIIYQVIQTLQNHSYRFIHCSKTLNNDIAMKKLAICMRSSNPNLSEDLSKSILNETFQYSLDIENHTFEHTSKEC